MNWGDRRMLKFPLDRVCLFSACVAVASAAADDKLPPCPDEAAPRSGHAVGATFLDREAREPDTATQVLDWLANSPSPTAPEGKAEASRGRFQTVEGPHAILIHQLSPIDAARRLAVIEATVDAFYREFEGLGFRLEPIRESLVSVAFRDRDLYRTALHRLGADGFANTSGFHHRPSGVVLGYDVRSTPEQRAGRRQLAVFRERIDRLSDADRPFSPLTTSTRLDRLCAEADARRAELDDDWLRIELGTVAHETVHQLAVASGLEPFPGAFPTWLHEGLAMQFEAIQDGRWAGLEVDSSSRLSDWRAIENPPRLAALLRDDGLRNGYRQEAYAASWALVAYLRREQSARFVKLIEALRSSRSSTAIAAAEALGSDYAAIEAGWLDWGKALKSSRDGGRPRK